MAESVRVASLEEIAPGTAKIVEMDHEPVALFNVDGKIYALSNTCVHAGGPLGEGSLDGKDVTCPWHAWSYNVTTGVCVSVPGARVKTYPVEVRDGQVFVTV